MSLTPIFINVYERALLDKGCDAFIIPKGFLYTKNHAFIHQTHVDITKIDTTK